MICELDFYLIRQGIMLHSTRVFLNFVFFSLHVYSQNIIGTRNNFWLGALNESVSEWGVCPMMDWIRVQELCLVKARSSCVWCTYVQGVLGRPPCRLRLVDTLPGCIPASHPVTAERDTTTLP